MPLRLYASPPRGAGKVIQYLSDQRLHIPYRDSKLTKLLMDTLGGNARALMVQPLPVRPARRAEGVEAAELTAQPR